MSNEVVKRSEVALGGGSMDLPTNVNGTIETLGAFLKSGQFPNQPNVYAALVSIETGKELGIPPMWALQTVYPIKGRMTMESKTMLALFQAKGGKSKWGEVSDQKAVLTLTLEGREPETFTYTADDAQKAGLLAKGGAWNTVRKAMLSARVISLAVRAYAPGVIMGMYSREEIEDDPTPAPVSAVDSMPKLETIPYEPEKKEAPKAEEPKKPESKPEKKAEPKKPKAEPKPPAAAPTDQEDVIDVEDESPKGEAPAGAYPMKEEDRKLFLDYLTQVEGFMVKAREGLAKRLTDYFGRPFDPAKLEDQIWECEADYALGLLGRTIAKQKQA